MIKCGKCSMIPLEIERVGSGQLGGTSEARRLARPMIVRIGQVDCRQYHKSRTIAAAPRYDRVQDRGRPAPIRHRRAFEPPRHDGRPPPEIIRDPGVPSVESDRSDAVLWKLQTRNMVSHKCCTWPLSAPHERRLELHCDGFLDPQWIHNDAVIGAEFHEVEPTEGRRTLILPPARHSQGPCV